MSDIFRSCPLEVLSGLILWFVLCVCPYVMSVYARMSVPLHVSSFCVLYGFLCVCQFLRPLSVAVCVRHFVCVRLSIYQACVCASTFVPACSSVCSCKRVCVYVCEYLCPCT